MFFLLEWYSITSEKENLEHLYLPSGYYFQAKTWQSMVYIFTCNARLQIVIFAERTYQYVYLVSHHFGQRK